MPSTLIEVTHALCPAVIAALAVSLTTSALARARRKLARIAWPKGITIELRLTLRRDVAKPGASTDAAARDPNDLSDPRQRQ